MPELPEVQTIVSQLNQKVLNRTFVDIWGDAPKLVKGGGLSSLKKFLLHEKIVIVKRIGKNILIYLTSGKILLIHLKLTGQLLLGEWQKNKAGWIESDSQEVKPYIHLIFFLDKGGLAFSDVRKFGKIEFFKEAALIKKKELQLGPDPTDKTFNFKIFKKFLAKKKSGKIKSILLDQFIIAGIGNIYSDEILWEAKIKPQRNVNSLKDDELKRIYLASKKVLKLAVKLRGESFSDYRDLFGSMGGYDKVKKVYQREGKDCYRCKAKIASDKIGGRTSRFCPQCQK